VEQSSDARATLGAGGMGSMRRTEEVRERKGMGVSGPFYWAGPYLRWLRGDRRSLVVIYNG
jgi:hypothetical protein